MGMHHTKLVRRVFPVRLAADELAVIREALKRGPWESWEAPRSPGEFIRLAAVQLARQVVGEDSGQLMHAAQDAAPREERARWRRGYDDPVTRPPLPVASSSRSSPAPSSKGNTSRARAGRVVVALVGCGKDKLRRRATAMALYTGAPTRAAIELAEARTQRGELAEWYVLSALHGIVSPYSELDPYNLTMEQLRRDKRKLAAWRVKVGASLAYLRKRHGAGLELEVYAGALYVRELRAAAKGAGVSITVSEPLAGLGTGHRKQKLAGELRKRA